jgi:hypothetical protein
MRLAVRFGPEIGQSILSYALDLSCANGYPNLSVLISGLRLSRRFATRPSALTTLAQSVEIDTGTPKFEDICFWPTMNRPGYIQFLGQQISATCVDLARPKVCVQCLEEGKPIACLWQLRCYLACPDHGTLLTHLCTACSQHLSWFRRASLICSCGAELRRQETLASDTLLELSSTLRAIFYGASRSHAVAPVSTLDAAARWVWFGGTHQPNERCWRSQYISKPGPVASQPIVERGAQLLIRWPEGLHVWLSQHRKSDQTALSSTFGPILTRLKNCFGEDDAFDPVIEEIRRFLARSSDAPLIGKRSFFYTGGKHLSKMISGAEASRRLWISSASVAKLVRDGTLDGESRVRGKRHAILIDRESLDGLLKLRGDSLSVRGAAHILGISDYQINRLLRSNLLAPAAKSEARKTRGLGVAFDSVLQLYSLLAERSQIRPFDRDHILLSNIPHLHNKTLAEVLARISHQDLEIFSDNLNDESAALLTHFFVKKEALFGFRKIGRQSLLSVTAASHRLHLAKRMIPF